MIVCIPAQENRGLDGAAYGHFGSARYFVIHNSESGETRTIDNANEHHEHGACQPLEALSGQKVDAIIVGGIGARAILKLNAMGARVFRAADASIKVNVEMLAQGSLPELTMDQACAGHGAGHGHTH